LRVLVTGSTGFIGENLCRRLKEEGYDVWCMERYVTGRYKRGRDYPTVFADLRDQVSLRRALVTSSPEVIIHLAALTPVSYSFQHPLEVNDVNYLGTIRLAETFLDYSDYPEGFIFASSSEVYGDQDVFPIRETARYNPLSPYAVSKVSCEVYLQYMYRTFDLPVVIVRPFNTYGRTRDHHFLVESAIYQMLTSDVCYLGDPDPERDFLYVDDHVSGYLSILDNLDVCIGETFNLCTGRSLSIREAVEAIRETTDFKGEIVWNSLPRRPRDIRRLQGSHVKVSLATGWHPKVSFEEGVSLTVDRWRENLGLQ